MRVISRIDPLGTDGSGRRIEPVVAAGLTASVLVGTYLASAERRRTAGCIPDTPVDVGDRVRA